MIEKFEDIEHFPCINICFCTTVKQSISFKLAFDGFISFIIPNFAFDSFANFTFYTFESLIHINRKFEKLAWNTLLGEIFMGRNFCAFWWIHLKITKICPVKNIFKSPGNILIFNFIIFCCFFPKYVNFYRQKIRKSAKINPREIKEFCGLAEPRNISPCKNFSQ